MDIQQSYQAFVVFFTYSISLGAVIGPFADAYCAQPMCIKLIKQMDLPTRFSSKKIYVTR